MGPGQSAVPCESCEQPTSAPVYTVEYDPVCPSCALGLLGAERDALKAALTELVTLKDGPRDADYERRKPAAWAAARAILEGEL